MCRWLTMCGSTHDVLGVIGAVIVALIIAAIPIGLIESGTRRNRRSEED